MTPIKTLAALAFLASALPVSAADFVKVESDASVSDTMAALKSAVESAGATVFTEVDHAAGAKTVGLDLPPSQLLVFGNPKLGTPAMQADPLAGLLLPLKVLVYEDSDGKVYLAYQEVEEMFDDLKIDKDAPYVAKMEGALAKLTGAAAGK